MRKFYSFNWVFVMLLFVFASCSQHNATEKQLTKSNQQIIYKGGAIQEDLSMYTPYKGRNFTKSTILPSSIDLSSKMPPVGNQESLASCIGWAVAYAYKTFQEGWYFQDGSWQSTWDVSKISHQFSPSWIYNQINGGQDNGASLSQGMILVVDKGVDTLVHFPYVDGDYSTQPDTTSMDRALRYKAASWTYFDNTNLNDIKEALVNGNVLPASLNVYQDFMDLSPENSIYNTKEGGYVLGHAIAIVGYDDTKQAFKFINSWGTSWGTYKDDVDQTQGKGYGWISYDFVVPRNSGGEYDTGLTIFKFEDQDNSDDTQIPLVNIISPVNNAQVNGNTEVTVTAYDNVEVKRVEFYINNTLIGFLETDYIESSQEYKYTIDMSNYSNGAHYVKVKAIDFNGNTANDEIIVDVQNFVCQEITDTNYQHVVAGRATTDMFNLYAYAVGSGEYLGAIGTQYFSTTTTLAESEYGYFIKGSCPPPDVEDPVVSLLMPIDGSTVSKNSTVIVSGNSTNVENIKVELVGVATGTLYYTQNLASNLENWSTALSTVVTWSGGYKIKVTGTNGGESIVKEISINIQ